MTFSRVSVAAYTTEPDHFLCMLNITETWSCMFPPRFRNTETCDFVLCLFLTIEILKATSTLTDSLFSSSDGALGVEAGGGGGGASPFSSPAGVERMKKCYQPQNRFTYYRNTVQKLKKKMCVKLRISYWYIGIFLRSSIHELMSIRSRL